MKTHVFYLLIFTLIIACATNPPVKTHKSKLYHIDWENRCIHRLADDDTVETLCYDHDPNFPDKCDDTDTDKNCLIGIRDSDRVKDLDYEALLINRCKDWR